MLRLQYQQNFVGGFIKMNDLIKELAEQAGIAVWGDAVYMYDPKDTLDSTVMEKFAKLIIREAADIATMNQHQWHCPGTYVLKHFGIDQ
jgi:hypothetical protein